jgi:hypothetical protein
MAVNKGPAAIGLGSPMTATPIYSVVYRMTTKTLLDFK